MFNMYMYMYINFEICLTCTCDMHVTCTHSIKVAVTGDPEVLFISPDCTRTESVGHFTNGPSQPEGENSLIRERRLIPSPG